MAARISLSRATITRTGHEPLTRVSVIVRNNEAKIRRGHVLLEQGTAVSVEALSRTEWTVTLDDGQVWHIKRERGG